MTEQDSQGLEADTFQKIALSQLNRVVVAATQEMRGGFYLTFTSKDGTEKENYVADSGEIFCNGVITLAEILLPHFNEKMEEAWVRYKIALKKIEQEFIDKSSVEEEIILGDVFYKGKDKILLETCKKKKIDLHRQLFEDLSYLMKKLNYFEIGGKTD